MLKVVWPHQALKAADLNDVAIIFGFIGQANQKQFESTHRYFRNLALLAKNDIFFQFEGTLFIEFIFSLKDAMLAYGDWDGRPETAEASIVGFYDTTASSPELAAMVKDFLQIADHMIANKMAPRALTLDDVIRAKMVFDVYFRVKAQRAYMEEVAKKKGAKPAIPIDAAKAVDKL
jgi:hypothetical protein